MDTAWAIRYAFPNLTELHLVFDDMAETVEITGNVLQALHALPLTYVSLGMGWHTHH